MAIEDIIRDSIEKNPKNFEEKFNTVMKDKIKNKVSNDLKVSNQNFFKDEEENGENDETD